MKILQLNETSILLPSSWNELTRSQLLNLCECLEKYSDINELRAILLFKMTGIKVVLNKTAVINGENCSQIQYEENQYGWISATDWAFASTAIDWMFTKRQEKDAFYDAFYYEIDSKLITNLLPTIDIKPKLTLVGPDDGLTNLILAEYIATETNLARWHKTHDEKFMNRFIAAIYRPKKAKKELKSPQFNGDYRQEFNEALVDNHIQFAEQLSNVEKSAILLWYNGCKHFIALKFPHVFKRSEGIKKVEDPFQQFIDMVAILADNKVNEKPAIRKALLFDVFDTLEKEAIKAIELEEKYGKK